MAATKKGRGAKGETVGLGAYFLSLTLENVRCFGEKQTLRLTDTEGRPARWTVLLGENGTGKTTLLQTLVTVAPQWAQIGREGVSWSLASGLLGHWTVACLPRGARRDDLAPHCDVSAGISFSHGVAEPRVEVQVGYTIDGWKHDGEQNDAPAIPSRFWRGGGRTSATCLVVAYGPYRRLSSVSLVEQMAARQLYLEGCETLFDSDATLPNAEEWYLQRDYEVASTHNPVAKTQRERVRQILLRVLPGVKEIKPVFDDPGKGKARLMAQTDDGLVPVSELGLGYQSVLAWVVDLASRLFTTFPDSPDPLAEPCVVLIDEIDIHLHPRWQRTLLEEISAIFKNAQFIVTAHSPLIVQAAPDANLAVLRRHGDHIVIDQTLGAVRNWRVDQILTSDLFGLPSARPAALDEPLARREAILAKDTLTKEDEAELARLREEIGALPGGESPLAMEAEDLLRRAAKKIDGAEPRPKTKPRARRA